MMLEMPIRERKMIRDVSVLLRGRKAMKQSIYQQNILHRQRMTCSESLRNVTQTQDWIGGMKMSPSGRFQVIEEAKPRQKVFSRKGIRWDAAWCALAAAAVLCALILLVEVISLGVSARSVSKLDTRIAQYMEKNEQLQMQLDESVRERELRIGTEAVKLNLISGNAVEKVILTAPLELSTGAVTAEVPGQTTGRLTGTTGD